MTPGYCGDSGLVELDWRFKCVRWEERKQHSLRREIWEEWEARKAVVNTRQAGRQLLMSRDVTHHHNRERLLSSCIRNCITENGRWNTKRTTHTWWRDIKNFILRIWKVLFGFMSIDLLRALITLHDVCINCPCLPHFLALVAWSHLFFLSGDSGEQWATWLEITRQLLLRGGGSWRVQRSSNEGAGDPGWTCVV